VLVGQVGDVSAGTGALFEGFDASEQLGDQFVLDEQDLF
jgi:hypothetical protein